MSDGPPADSPHDRPRRLVALAIGGLGVSAMTTQLVLMREMLAAFCGNELVLGVLLGNWLLLTGLGSFLGRAAGRLKAPVTWLIVAQMLIAVLPPVQVLALRSLRDVVFVRGAMIGAAATVVSSFVLLLPYCLVSGFMLTAACSILSAGDARAIGKVYLADSLGDMLGGAMFSLVLVWWLDHFAALYIPAAINLPLAGALAWRTRRRVLAGVGAALLAGLIAVVATTNLDQLSTALQYPFQKVLFRGNSPYGRWVVAESAGQVNFIANGLPVVSTGNVQQVEETVHYAMAQRPGARRVLLIGGGLSGAAREVLKYPSARVTCVELDPQAIELGRRFLPEALNDPRMTVVTTDGRLFVQRTGREFDDSHCERFDVVLLDVPAPATAQVNRFYTVEFFAELKRCLAPDGVVSAAMGQFDGRVSPELARMLATTRRTLETSFANVVPVPGGEVFLLASDGALTEAIAERIESAGVATKLINRSYLDAMLTPDRVEAVRSASAQAAEVNGDFHPVLYHHHLRYWTAQFRTPWVLPAVLGGLALVVYLVRIRAVALAIFASGFAASSLEVVLLLGFQVLCGAVYVGLAGLVTVFMAGLAVGAGVANRLPVSRPRRGIAALAVGIVLLACLIPSILKALAALAGAAAGLPVTQVAVGALAFGLAAMVGGQFALAGRAGAGAGALAASRLYVADFVGACTGALLASAVLIPLAGLAATCLLAGALNLVAAVVVARSRPR